MTTRMKTLVFSFLTTIADVLTLPGRPIRWVGRTIRKHSYTLLMWSLVIFNLAFVYRALAKHEELSYLANVLSAVMLVVLWMWSVGQDRTRKNDRRWWDLLNENVEFTRRLDRDILRTQVRTIPRYEGTLTHDVIERETVLRLLQ